MKNKIALIVGAVVLLGAVFFLGVKMYKGNQADELAKIDETKFMPDYAPRLGPATAKVKLVEFLDPECESCRMMYPHVKQLMQEFEGNVQLIIRYAPFHQNSKLAIKILEAARKQGKYWETLEVLFKYQPDWGSHHDPKPQLIWNHLPEAGVDVERLKSDMIDDQMSRMIDKEFQDAKDLGVRATPSFFANGTPLEEFSPEGLKKLIEKEINR